MVGTTRIYEFIRVANASPKKKLGYKTPNEVFCASLLLQQKLHLRVQSA